MAVHYQRTPPQPQTKGTIVGNNGIYRWESLMGPFFGTPTLGFFFSGGAFAHSHRAVRHAPPPALPGPPPPPPPQVLSDVRLVCTMARLASALAQALQASRAPGYALRACSYTAVSLASTATPPAAPCHISLFGTRRAAVECAVQPPCALSPYVKDGVQRLLAALAEDAWEVCVCPPHPTLRAQRAACPAAAGAEWGLGVRDA